MARSPPKRAQRNSRETEHLPAKKGSGQGAGPGSHRKLPKTGGGKKEKRLRQARRKGGARGVATAP
eukprot:1228453-Alexandrium_andersonii.AAC.1